jgi:hypothetical protein
VEVATGAIPQLDPWKWPRGQSGNQRGRPRRSQIALEALRLNTPRAAEKLKELLDCGHPTHRASLRQCTFSRAAQATGCRRTHPEALKMLKERLETGKLRLVEVRQKKLPLSCRPQTELSPGGKES